MLSFYFMEVTKLLTICKSFKFSIEIKMKLSAEIQYQLCYSQFIENDMYSINIFGIDYHVEENFMARK